MELHDEVAAAAQALVARLDQAAAAVDPSHAPELAAALAQTALDDCLDRLAVTHCWGEANRVPSSRLWQIAGPWLQRGTLQLHARSKPRGYAGDFELLAKICRRVTCDDPWGRAFDHYFLEQAACNGVRQRVGKTAGLLVQQRLDAGPGPFHAVSVGAGPAFDLLQAAAMLPAKHRDGLRVGLIDLDPEALECAAAELTRHLPPPAVTAFRENLFRLPQRAACPGGAADFLVCSGLFDYLAADAAAAMLGWFWSQLNPGGRLVVCNFAPENRSRAYMEWIGNWYLIYRDADAMRAMIRQAGIPAGCTKLSRDQSGTVWMLTADRSR